MPTEEENSSIHTYVFIDENPVINLQNMINLENKINKVLAANWWNKYIAAAFWSNMSTPINLTIMLLTTLTTGQATTNNLLSSESFVSVSIASLILSVVNTFFRPHEQMNDNIDIMRKWQSLGLKFERIFYSKNNDNLDHERRLQDYAHLQKEIHSLQNAPTPTNQNFFTDFIYYISSHILRKRKRNFWINDEDLPKVNNENRGVQTSTTSTTSTTSETML